VTVRVDPANAGAVRAKFGVLDPANGRNPS
jgi:hypothetical protein